MRPNDGKHLAKGKGVHREMRKHETTVCRTARTVVWEVGKREVGGKHFYQRLPPTRLKAVSMAF